MPRTLEPGELNELFAGDEALDSLRSATPHDEGETDSQSESVDESNAPNGDGGWTARSRQNCVHDDVLQEKWRACRNDGVCTQAREKRACELGFVSVTTV